jgi:hypothetical protein
MHKNYNHNARLTLIEGVVECEGKMTLFLFPIKWRNRYCVALGWVRTERSPLCRCRRTHSIQREVDKDDWFLSAFVSFTSMNSTTNWPIATPTDRGLTGSRSVCRTWSPCSYVSMLSVCNHNKATCVSFNNQTLLIWQSSPTSVI